MASKNKIESGIDKIVAQELEARVKTYKKKHLHYISFLKWVSSPDFLALVALHHYKHILKIKKQYPGLTTELIFAMQYLYKVTYATKPEIRFMLEKSLPEWKQVIYYKYLVERGLVVRDVHIRPGGKYINKEGEEATFNERRLDIFVITDAGREFVRSLGCEDIVRHMFNNWITVNNPRQKIVYKKRNQHIAKNPEKFKR